MIGNLARLDEYPSDLPSLAQDLPPEAGWQLGALAAQNEYRPLGNDPWSNTMAPRAKPAEERPNPLVPFSAWRADPPKRTSGVIASDYALPQTPTDLGLMAVGGPFGKAALVAGRMLDADPAQAGKKIKTGTGFDPGNSIFRQGASIVRAPPPWQAFTADEFARTASAPPVPHQDITRINTFENPRLRAKAEALWEKYPQYAEQYPEIGPPALMEKRPDPKKPGSYLTTKPLGEVPYSSFEEAAALDATPRYFFEKRLLPPVAQFQKDRNTVQREMDLHGYTPYFDPAQRADIPASDYGPFLDTRVAADPKTQATRDKFNKEYGTDEARARLQAGFEKGQTLGNAEDWYFMKQLQDEYVKVLGPAAGKEAFKKEFSGMMAATTGGASPYDNFLMSHWANYLNKQGENVAKRAYEMPFPIGGRFASGNMKQAQKFIDEGMVGFNPEKNPKRYDFDNALAGDVNAGVMDEQMFGAIKPGETIPKWYGPATRTLHEEAAKIGHNSGRGVRGFQDVGWAGLKALSEEERLGVPFKYEGPMINQINRSIETTHRLTGMPKDEIVRRGLILKEIPMYGVGASVAAALAARLSRKGMGDLARQDDYQPEERM